MSAMASNLIAMASNLRAFFPFFLFCWGVYHDDGYKTGVARKRKLRRRTANRLEGFFKEGASPA